MVDTTKIEKEFSTAMEHLQKYREMAENYDDEEAKAAMLKKIAAQEEKLAKVKEKALSGEVPHYSR